ncbi:PepSY domain-containing protein [Marivibrio halodurans]|uniref:PepSY domain-containing protein n=1 Tax=Marivibrio halodurans TaxID=2039722 RepID=A0A8J7V1T8_9PROT|nr:PepSY-associated TM helix domain-containing protein [Marivibrio halodurans]MBP5856451.1 PepSY domain-containing protein [Marivibrio halodurans]
MKGTFRQSMGWLHIWAGLVVGWVLFFVFLTGTAGYFDEEIDRWMEPERPLPEVAMPTEKLLGLARAHLESASSDAEYWTISFPGYRSSDLYIFWRDTPQPGGKTSGSGRVFLNPATAEPIAHRETGGGNLLYRMHWRLHYMPMRTAEWIVGVCTMFMLVAIITGIIVHRRIFKDFFTFRPHKGQRSWLDAHNVLSVLALPFHLMITWSGLIFLAYIYMAPVMWASYGVGEGEDSQKTFFNELYNRTDAPDPAGLTMPLVPLEPLLHASETRMGVGEVKSIRVYNPGDANARVVIRGGELNPSRALAEMTFDGTTGMLLHEAVPRSVPLVTFQTLLGLHEGLFAGPVLRWIYFLSGLMGTAMIGAGLILWTVKRRLKIGDGFGFRLVERLNIATIVGLPVAIAAYFWANRLIPLGIENRAAWEAHAMFIAWAVMSLHAFTRPAARGWVEQLWIAAGAFGLLPILNALTTDRHLGVTLPARAWELAGFDLTVLAFGAAFAVAARQVARHRRSDPTPGKKAQISARRKTEAAE